MHEMGTVLTIVDTVEDLCRQYRVPALGYVKVEVGKLSSVLSKYLLLLWPQGTKGTVCEGVPLQLEQKEGIAQCRGCGKQYRVTDHLEEGYPVCPFCDSKNYSIVQGADIFVTELGIPDS